MKMFSSFLALMVILLLSDIVHGRIGGGNISYSVKKAKGVTFSHDFHVQELGLACQKCHPSIYVTKGKDKPVTMTQMYDGKSCGACHTGKEAFTLKGNCSKCHQ